MNEQLENIIENTFDCLIDDLGCLMGDEWKSELIKEAVTKAFVLGGVSQQSELLAFLDWIGKNTPSYSVQKPKKIVQAYLKANCG